MDITLFAQWKEHVFAFWLRQSDETWFLLMNRCLVLRVHEQIYRVTVFVLSYRYSECRNSTLACDYHAIKTKQQQKLDTMLDDDDDYDEDEDDGCNNLNDDNNNDATTTMMDFFDHEPTIREKMEV